jgi:hypothetical protein
MDARRKEANRRGAIKTMLLRLLAASLFFAAGCPASAQQPPSSDEVRIVPSPAGSGSEDTTYEIGAGACRIRWTVSRSGVNRGIAQHRAECSLPLSEQIALNARILDKVLEGEPTFRTLFLGRLKPFPELSIRLAAEAVRSPGWDARRGRPKSAKSVDLYLLELFALRGSGVFAEWKRLFEAKRLTFAVSGVEEALVGRVGALPYFPEFSARGLKAGDQAPFDCLIWFSAAHPQ